MQVIWTSPQEGNLGVSSGLENGGGHPQLAFFVRPFGSPAISECWIIEETAGHRWTETWAGALQAEVAKGMLLTSRKIYREFRFHHA